MKRQPTDWEKTCTFNPTSKGFIVQIYKDLKRLSNKKPNKPIKQQATVNRRNTNGQQFFENLINILSNKGNAN